MSVLEWLLSGDVSIQYQVHKSLLQSPVTLCESLRNRIPYEGFGKRFLDKFDAETGLWGEGVYSPKFTSTHYTILDLKTLGLPPTTSEYQIGVKNVLDYMWTNKGEYRRHHYQDMCVSGMMLSMGSYAKMETPKLAEIVDYILLHQYSDGGWNCAWQRGHLHSSLHTTLTNLEAIREYQENGYTYRLDELLKAVPRAQEFILKKHFFRSVHTGEIIHPDMLLLRHPVGWKYDMLRALEYFASVGHPYDERMQEALEILRSSQLPEGTWKLASPHSGKYHFRMETTGKPSRWITLRVLKVWKAYRPEWYALLIQR